MSSKNTPPTTRRDLIKAAAVVGMTSTAPALAATARNGEGRSNSNVRLFDPDQLPPSPGFSQVVEVGRGRLVYIAGQVPRSASGELVGPGDLRAQLEQVFRNLDTAVRGAGGTFADIVKLNYYCVPSVEPAQTRAVVEVRDRYVNTKAPPISTFVFVNRLVSPDWLIEIEAVAVLPEHDSTGTTHAPNR